jgi:hypothetical protein
MPGRAQPCGGAAVLAPASQVIVGAAAGRGGDMASGSGLGDVKAGIMAQLGRLERRSKHAHA